MKSKTERAAMYSLVFSSFDLVANLPHVQNKWISLQVWLELMKLHTLDLDVNKSTFKRAMTNDKINKTSSNLTIVNDNGYYFARSKVMIEGRYQNVDAILVTTPGALPQRIQCISWRRAIIMHLPPSWCTRTRIPTPRAITPPPPSKRSRISTYSQSQSQLATPLITQPQAQLTTQSPQSQPTTQSPQSHPTTQLPQAQLTTQSQSLPTTQPQSQVTTQIYHKTLSGYWESPEARKYFGWFEPVGEDVEVSVREIMKERIVTLRNAALTMHGWRNIIDNGDVDNICDAPFIINIKRKCQFLSKALSVLYIDRKKATLSTCHGKIVAN